MNSLFEKSDALSTPTECFMFDASKESFPVKPHWHYYMELIYMIDGSAEMHCGDDVFTAGKGDMVLFHPQTVHSIYSSDTGALRYAVLKFDINKLGATSAYSPKMRSIFLSANQKKMNTFFTAEQTASISAEEHFLNCICEVRHQKYGCDMMIKAGISSLMMKIVRFWLSHGFSIEDDTFALDTEYSIETITEYIDLHLGEGLQVSEIARQCGMSYSYFARQFRYVYGKTCKEYIEQMRIFKVEDYLMFTDFDLNYISQETGFSDCSHMIKSFRHFRGITPKQYRKKGTQRAAAE